MNGFPMAISIIAMVALGIFTLAVWSIWLSSRNHVSAYERYGFAMGFVIIGFEIITLILMAITGIEVPLLAIIAADIFVVLRIAGFTVVGIWYCAQMELFSLPYLIQAYERPTNDAITSDVSITSDPATTPDADITPDAVVISTHSPPQLAEAIIEAVAEEEIKAEAEAERIKAERASFLLKPRSLSNMLVTSSIVAIAGILFSLLLFWLTEPRISDIVREQLESTESDSLLVGLVALVAVAFAEEIIFRLGIQNILAKCFDLQGNRYWWAIIATAGLWTLAHSGTLEPNWVKMVQVFPFGLALGWLFKRYGTESTILAHALFNVVIAIPAPFLIG